MEHETTYDKMQYLAETFEDSYYHFLGQMVMDGFSIEYTVDFLYYSMVVR